MTVCQAVAIRTKNLLSERKMTQYRLEQESGIQHGTMNGIMSAKNRGIELNTVMMIARGFQMTVLEFFRVNQLTHKKREELFGLLP